MTITKSELHIYRVVRRGDTGITYESFVAVNPIAMSTGEPMDVRRDLVPRLPDGYSDDDIMYYFESYEEFEKFEKSPDYLEGMGDVLSVESVYYTESLTPDHIRFKREKYMNDMMYRFSMRVIKDVSNLEQDIRKAVPSETWDDTMATLENQLYGLLDGYFYFDIKKNIITLEKWASDNRDEVAPNKATTNRLAIRMWHVIHDVTSIYRTMQKTLVPTENL